MIIFDGNAFARAKEPLLRQRVDELKQRGKTPTIAAVLFTEDKGSQLYTELKKQAAKRIGMRYLIFPFSINDEVGRVIEQIAQLNQDPDISGIIIQKPGKKRWLETRQAVLTTATTADAFIEWWHTLVSSIAPQKDVDGLHPETLLAIEKGTWRKEGKVMPATAKAVLDILEQVTANSPQPKIIILGKSDILGQPLFFELGNQGREVEMLGTRELEERQKSGQLLLDADIIISATGHAGLITGQMIKSGAVLVDVGEPKPDIDASSVANKAAFLTPVPGGVGPVTIISLLENCLDLMGKRLT